MAAGPADGQPAAGPVRLGPAVVAQRDLLGEDAARLLDLGQLDDDRAASLMVVPSGQSRLP